MEVVDLKLVLLGQPGVGKTCLVYRYLYNTFGETISTIGASFAMKKIESNGRPCNLGIWDTAGQERFDSLSSFYCRGARAAIICFDLTDRASFECLQSKWVKKVPRPFVGRLGRPTPQPAPRLPTPPHRHCPASSAAARRHTPRRGLASTRDRRGGVVCVCV
mmetsp:Transcript_37875/g.126724  ORF Transcript_37875/g.126724 Transcript_37875/m.126724 type:complete len:162 (-) Transcript_37875:354-839(-)